MPTRSVGQVLQAAREKAKISQSELAEAAGLAANHVARLERGEKAFPRFDTIAKLAAELGLSLDTIAAECGFAGFSRGGNQGVLLRGGLKAVQTAIDRLAEAQADLETTASDLRRGGSAARRRPSS